MFTIQAQLDRHQEDSTPMAFGRVAAPAVVIAVMVGQIRVVRAPGRLPDGLSVCARASLKALSHAVGSLGRCVDEQCLGQRHVIEWVNLLSVLEGCMPFSAVAAMSGDQRST